MQIVGIAGELGRRHAWGSGGMLVPAGCVETCAQVEPRRERRQGRGGCHRGCQAWSRPFHGQVAGGGDRFGMQELGAGPRSRGTGTPVRGYGRAPAGAGGPARPRHGRARGWPGLMAAPAAGSRGRPGPARQAPCGGDPDRLAPARCLIQTETNAAAAESGLTDTDWLIWTAPLTQELTVLDFRRCGSPSRRMPTGRPGQPGPGADLLTRYGAWLPS